MSDGREAMGQERPTVTVDEQEAKAGVGKTLDPLVDGRFETLTLEEYGEGWTGHTAAYDDYFGHLRPSYALRVYCPIFKTRTKTKKEARGSKDVLSARILFGGGRLSGRDEPSR
jgi:hypothetical protein